MNAIERQLKKLRDELTTTEASIAEVKETHQQTKKDLEDQIKERERITERLIALDHEHKKVVDAGSTLEAERKLVREESESVRQSLAEWVIRLTEDLSEEHRMAIQAAMKEVDDEIGEQQNKVEEEQTKIDSADKDALADEKKLANNEAAIQESIAQLRSLREQIKTLRIEATNHRTAAEAAMKQKDKSEAYFLIMDLQSSLERLDQKASPEMEQPIIANWRRQQARALTLKGDLANAAVERDRLSQKLANEKEVLLAMKGDRVERIRANLAKIQVEEDDEEEPGEVNEAKDA